jgi:4-carboxymuconolactone decarboxylase
MSDRYRKGVDIIQHLAAGHYELFMAGKVAEVAPDFARMAVEFPFGDLYSRDRLDLRSREIAAIASLATIGDAVPQLRDHIGAALHLGVSKTEIVEILMQTAVYAGFPAALRSLAACHDLLVAECGDDQAACRVAGQG